MEDTAVLPISLKPSNLRPLAYRIFSKKYGLNIQSGALEILSLHIGKKIGNEWRGPKTTNLLEEIAKTWKDQDKGLFLDGDNIALILKEITMKQEREKTNIQSSTTTSFPSGKRDSLIDNDTTITNSPSFTIHSDIAPGPEVVSNSSQDANLKWQDFFKVIDASHYKRFKYNRQRKQFDVSSRSSTENSLLLTLPNISDNVDYFVDRFHLLKDRLLRNENFQPASFSALNSMSGAATSSLQQHQITVIKNLLGRHGNRFLLFGLLTKSSAGLWQLQDDTDHIDLELGQCLFPSNSYFTPGNYVICDGIYSSSSKFYVSSMIHPPSEKRELSLDVLGYLDFNSTFSKNGKIDIGLRKNLFALEKKNITHKFIILGGDIYLSDLRILESLDKLFTKLTKDINEEAADPVAIVFSGPFSEVPFDSTPSSSTTQTTSSGIYKSYFDSLAAILEKFPDLCKSAKFIFVPGDHDPWSSMVTKNANSFWPKMKIPRVFGSRLSRIVRDIEWCSNPCRLNYLSHDVVIVRDDLGDRFRRNDISYLSKAKEEEADSDVLEIDKLSKPKISTETFESRKVVKTLLDQGNLSPFTSSVRPVLTNYGNSLSLVPLPTLLVLVDSTSPKFDLIYENCHVVNPGKFQTHNKINYIEYFPSTRKASIEEIFY
ncbi:hypothetical protein CANARDRAFT_6292 [[Candida] arabinofermentans NRRL YB-2248]|uniref:DNA polymerase epsilon subunit B n=1 Tax=[Candida] arabinofermentans NRRL YB-2248 TaxID=983967 RepID=A0A1E4T4M4_9ASCO|nr:hypothetical protein CANARDRAFT_6292 [[Candida] arabinofermentans NRRL YB-2248]